MLNLNLKLNNMQRKGNITKCLLLKLSELRGTSNCTLKGKHCKTLISATKGWAQSVSKVLRRRKTVPTFYTWTFTTYRFSRGCIVLCRKLLRQLEKEVDCGEAGQRMGGFADGCSHGGQTLTRRQVLACTILRFVMFEELIVLEFVLL